MKTEGAVATEVIQDIDKIIPYFINKAMPDWFAALLCSVSFLQVCLRLVLSSTQWEHRLVLTFMVLISPVLRGKLTNVIRLGVLFSILVSYIICYMLPHDIIARGTSIFMGICAAAFLPAYFCALYWKKATKQGVMQVSG